MRTLEQIYHDIESEETVKDDIYNLSLTGEDLGVLLVGVQRLQHELERDLFQLRMGQYYDDDAIQRMKDYGELYKRLFRKLEL